LAGNDIDDQAVEHGDKARGVAFGVRVARRAYTLSQIVPLAMILAIGLAAPP
jgi:hypothetical protein